MGLTEIANVFARSKAEGRPALMPYWPLGYPDAETSLRVIEAIVRAGADMLELGIPFSDPLADGPVIQHASQVALEHGASVQKCIDLAGQLRARGIRVPMLAMGYLNPLIAFGEAHYVQAWRAAGADGFIVPDLPPEESAALAATCATNNLALIQFTAPTSTEQRVEQAAKRATGFIYIVAVTGVTGARDRLAAGLHEYVDRVKAHADGKPVVVGFGISKPEHVREVGQFADGVIVASALIRAASNAPDPAQAAYDFVKQLKQ
jgi:tryptophan synthase alpha chain